MNGDETSNASKVRRAIQTAVEQLADEMHIDQTGSLLTLLPILIDEVSRVCPDTICQFLVTRAQVMQMEAGQKHSRTGKRQLDRAWNTHSKAANALLDEAMVAAAPERMN